jgi:hypothetical protein
MYTVELKVFADHCRFKTNMLPHFDRSKQMAKMKWIDFKRKLIKKRLL